jgi:hypothetical protein
MFFYELSTLSQILKTLHFLKTMLVFGILAALSLQTSLLCQTKSHTTFPTEIQN